MVLVSFLVDGIVTKYTNKAPKPKRKTKITFDSAMERSIDEVATYNQNDGVDMLDIRNFEITCTDLG